MTIFAILFQAASIWMQFKSNSSALFSPYSTTTGWTGGLIMVLSFTMISTFCVNLVNIYFASAALELIVPSFSDARGYAIIGLIGALAFGFLGGENVASHLESITNNCIGSLGAVLLVAYLARNVITHRHRRHEKTINIICWSLGCLASFLVYFLENKPSGSFVGGVTTSLIAFVIIIFIEETVWSIRQIFFTDSSEKT